jgi:short-subunit dehydrogenase
MSEEDEYVDGSPIWDSLDIDLFVKVFSHTAFSPFFVMLIPTFYVFQGAKFTDTIVLVSAAYYVFVSSFWAIKWISRLYSNQGNLLYAPRPFEWGEQIVVITGGSSGVGELLANTLAVKSVTVVVLDIKPIQTQNYNIAYYKCDVSKWEEVEAVSKKIIEEIGQPTVLVNNAGVVQGKLILDLSPEDIQQTFGVNTLSHFWILKAFLPGMIAKKKGHIVTMASVMGIQGVAQMTDYCASKAALINLNRSLRSELDKRYKCPAIRTTLVCPGHIHTPLFATLNPPPQFFFPTLHPIDVVKRVIQALDETHSQTILLPFYAHFLPYLQLLPDWFADFASWVSNADFAMKDFVKLSGRREEEGPAPLVDSKEETGNGFKTS